MGFVSLCWGWWCRISSELKGLESCGGALFRGSTILCSAGCVSLGGIFFEQGDCEWCFTVFSFVGVMFPGSKFCCDCVVVTSCVRSCRGW